MFNLWIVFWNLWINVFCTGFNDFKKRNIIKAFKENIKFHKLLTLKERISLIGIMGIWIVLENGLIQILPDALIKNADFNRYFLKNLIISSRFRIYILFCNYFLQLLYFYSISEQTPIKVRFVLVRTDYVM